MTESFLRLLSRPYLGSGSARIQMHSVQAAHPQKVPQAYQDQLQHGASGRSEHSVPGSSTVK